MIDIEKLNNDIRKSHSRFDFLISWNTFLNRYISEAEEIPMIDLQLVNIEGQKLCSDEMYNQFLSIQEG